MKLCKCFVYTFIPIFLIIVAIGLAYKFNLVESFQILDTTKCTHSKSNGQKCDGSMRFIPYSGDNSLGTMYAWNNVDKLKGTNEIDGLKSYEWNEDYSNCLEKNWKKIKHAETDKNKCPDNKHSWTETGTGQNGKINLFTKIKNRYNQDKKCYDISFERDGTPIESHGENSTKCPSMKTVKTTTTKGKSSIGVRAGIVREYHEPEKTTTTTTTRRKKRTKKRTKSTRYQIRQRRANGRTIKEAKINNKWVKVKIKNGDIIRI